MYRAQNHNISGYRNMDNFGTHNSDSFTTVTYRRNPGYFERVGSSACGIFFGFLIFVAAFPVLFLNEGRAVQTAKSLDEGLKTVISLADSDEIWESNNRKLVHFSGSLKTTMPLTDNEFGISISAAKLRRHVEMFQWVEHEHKREYNEGDRTRIEKTYTYSTEWKSENVKSDRFSVPTGHHNPSHFPISSITKTASPVFVGNFQLSKGLVSYLSTYHDFDPQRSRVSDFIISDKYFYKSQDHFNPKVGDLRVSFSYAGLSNNEDQGLGKPDEVSIIAQQTNGGILTPFQTEAGDSLEILYYGVKTAKEIFDGEHSTNSVMTWLLRFGGWLMMFIAFQVMMDIIRQIVSFVPIIREIVALATTLLAFTLASSFALVTIAIGWLRYRPLVALSLFFAAAVPLYFSRYKAEKEKKERKQ